MTARMFPVLFQGRDGDAARKLGCPREIPWSFLEPHEARAKRNHDQTLQRLAERGGLSPAEIMCVIEDRGLFTGKWEGDIAATPRLKDALDAWRALRGGAR
jgi:hypothetical protein